MQIVRGPGPRWFRIVLAVVAALYFIGLVKHPPQRSILRPIGFFTECTCLFPGASKYALEFRLEAWSCAEHGWRALDPRPYFPIEADDKESRFQRLGYFYQGNRTAMRALDDYVAARHPDVDDAVTGSIGGIRLFKLDRPLPEPGEPVAPYVYRPLEPGSRDQRKDLYWTKASERKQRCGGAP